MYEKIGKLLIISLILFSLIMMNCLPTTDDDPIDDGDGGDDGTLVIISTYPEDNSTNITIDTNITIEFNRDMNPETINDSTFMIKSNLDFSKVKGNINYDNKIITFKPINDLKCNHTYIVRVTSEIEDLDGNNLIDDYEFSFSTESDTYNPFIVSHSPEDNADNLPTSTIVTVSFNENIDQTTLSSSSIYIKDNLDNIIDSNISYSDKTVTLEPMSDLIYDTEYMVILTPDITDLSGNPLQDYFFFTFIIEPDIYPPMITNYNPVDGESEVSRGISITIEFNEEIDQSTINPSSVYVEDEFSNIITGTILYNDKTITFNPTQQLDYSTTYNVNIINTIEDLTGNTLLNSLYFNFITEDYLKVVSHTPTMDETEVESSTYIEINFNKDVDITTIYPSNFTLQNSDNGNAVQCEFELIDSDTLLLKPKYVFTYSGVEHQSEYTGIKPNYNYNLTLKSGTSGIISETDCIMDTDFNLNFKTKDLDYGLYWFGDGNEAYKYVSGRDNPFYDPSKPTIIYTHGWQQDSVLDRDYGRECFVFGYDGNVIHTDVSQAWRDAGWNTGIFFWNQFADEPPETVEPEKAEAKIYSALNGYTDMRYKVYYPSTGSVGYSTTYSPDVSVAELFQDIYIDALSDNTSGSIRIAGHSLGNQLVTRFTWLIKNSYDNGTIGKSIMPNRVALLDPYWSGGDKGYLGGITVGEKCTIYTAEFVSYYNNPLNNLNDLDFVLEQYHTSKLSGGLPFGIGGDKNEPIRDYTVYIRSWYDFADTGIIPLDQEGVKHNLTPRMYFYSYSFSPPVMHTAGDDIIGPSASASNYDMNILMNYYYTHDDKGMCEQTSGKDTLDPADDEFTYFYLY
jgi:hypothetical protein